MRLGLIVALPFLGALLPILLARAGRGVCGRYGPDDSDCPDYFVDLCSGSAGGRANRGQLELGSAAGNEPGLQARRLGVVDGQSDLGDRPADHPVCKYYLSATEPAGVFYTYLLVFQGAMVGIALSNNVLTLLVFWELTSLASFLLIGFWRHLPEGRQGARMALVVTGGGGLALTGGMLLLGGIAGTYKLDEILAASETIKASPWYLMALLLIAVACFTKSAQFPFHFWLPRAMAAPTPVSAYLHSATMVKAGSFARAPMARARYRQLVLLRDEHRVAHHAGRLGHRYSKTISKD